MAIEPGTRFGPYEISESIGAGGMGEVYRATDTNLKRDVAIKVLPASLANDESRLARFQREAEMLASLNHPNIGHIYGLERSDDTIALVLELVEGPTLEDRISDGALPVDEALGIAKQIADALETAHGQGIVHRDLKPANIKLRPDGTVKVLDFGIAKALDVRAASGLSPIMTTPTMTQTGIILGSAQYMAPEQARGKGVDQRADIWAFGCVLYEMLTGQPAFGGEDVTIILARILERDADTGSLPDAISPAVKQTIKACLQKDLRKRVADIRDVRLALEGTFVPDEYPSPHTPAQIRRPLRGSLFGYAVALGVGAFLAGLAAWTLWPTSEPSPVNRFDYDLPANHSLRASGRPVFALAPDGRHFAYNTASGIYVRAMDELEPHLLPGTAPVITSPGFSPDGQSVVYWEFASQELKRVPVSGGQPVAIASVRDNPHGVDWGPDGNILIGQSDGIYRVPAEGGALELLIPTGGQELFFGPQMLPDGDTILFSASDDALEWNESRIVVQTLSTGVRNTVIEQGSDAHYLPSGHIIYASGEALFGTAFDLETLSASGGDVPLMQGLMRATANLTGTANYGVSADGTLAYLRGQRATQLRTLVWVDREGNEEAIDIPRENYTSVRISPDGRRAVLDTFDENMDIWIWDFERRSREQITRSLTLNGTPIWSLDGDSIAWSRAQSGTMQEIYWQSVSGAGVPQALTTRGVAVSPTDFTPDGFLLYSEFLPPKDIWIVPVDGPATNARKLIATEAEEFNATVSPDGRWLAYQSDESGQIEIYVRPFPDVESARRQVSFTGGSMPVWSNDGGELYYYVDRGVTGVFMRVPVEVAPTFDHGAPEPLFDGPYVPPFGIAAPSTSFYDVAADGRFLIIKDVAADSESERAQVAFVEPPQVIVVQNWIEELRERVPTN